MPDSHTPEYCHLFPFSLVNRSVDAAVIMGVQFVQYHLNISGTCARIHLVVYKSITQMNVDM